MDDESRDEMTEALRADGWTDTEFREMDDEDLRAELRARRHLQDEIEISSLVGEAARSRNLGDARLILEQYGNYLELRPAVLDELPRVERTVWGR